jgi:short-subunit dehydrogenase
VFAVTENGDFFTPFEINFLHLFVLSLVVIMKNYLVNKTVVLTGASSGIGREMSEILVTKYGATVVGVGRNEEKLSALKEELKDNFTCYSFDVSSRENWIEFAQKLKSEGVCPDLLINNAGAFPQFSTFKNSKSDTVEGVLKNNFLSAVYGAETLMGVMKQEGGIVNVCSSSALCPVVGTSAYSASKSAMKGFTECLIMEERKRYVGIIYPGTTKTELFRNDENTQNSALDIVAMKPQKMAKKILKKIAKRKKRAVVGWDAKAMNLVAKVAPVLGLRLICWVMRISKSKVFKEVFEE